MPTTENDRRNLQKPTLERPSLPDHDRRKDEGMHQVQPATLNKNADEIVNVEAEVAPPDQEFEQLLASGPNANGGRIPEDPNNELTSDVPAKDEYNDEDPENRGECQPDELEGIQH